MHRRRHLVRLMLAAAIGGGGAVVALAIDRQNDLVSAGSAAAAFRAASADLSRVVFATDEALLPQDQNVVADAYVRNADGSLGLVTSGSAASTGEGGLVVVPQNGSRAIFPSGLRLVPADGDVNGTDLYAREIDGSLTLISGGGGPGDAFFEGLTPDGSRVYFTTSEALVATDDDGAAVDLYERRNDGTLTLVSDDNDDGVGTDPNASADGAVVVSTDGSRVAFRTSDSSLDTKDEDDALGGDSDVYLRDMASGTVSIISDNDQDGSDPDTGVFTCCLATPALDKVYFSTAQPLLATDLDVSGVDGYEWTAAGLALMGGGTSSATPAGVIAVSAYGARVFVSTMAPLLPGDGDGSLDVYQRARPSGVLSLVTPGTATADATFGATSSDGTRLFFTTTESLPGTGDPDVEGDVYEVNSAGAITLISGGSANAPATFGFGDANEPPGSRLGPGGRSVDGTRVFFTTAESLLPQDGDALPDVYERSGGALSLVGQGAGPDAVDLRAVSTDGARVALETDNPLAAADTDGAQDVYIARPPTPTPVPPPAPSSPPTADTTPPRLTLTGARLQRLGKRRVVVVQATCSEPCRVRGTATLRRGKLRFALTPVVRTLQAGRRTSLVLKVPTKRVRSIVAVLGPIKTRAGVTVTVRATDLAGNATSRRRAVLLRK
jgi:hypothetical protein